MTHVVFLRGVNVGGYKTFQPSVLAKQLKHCDVVNIGAAGTFVVRNPISKANLRGELIRRLPFEAEIMICSKREIVTAAAGNPFKGQPSGPDIVHFVGVLAKRPRGLPDLPLSLPADDWLVKLIAIQDRFAFGYTVAICAQLRVSAKWKNEWACLSPCAIGIQSMRLSKSSKRMPSNSTDWGFSAMAVVVPDRLMASWDQTLFEIAA